MTNTYLYYFAMLTDDWYHFKYLTLYKLRFDELRMISGILFQIEDPKNTNVFLNNSILGFGYMELFRNTFVFSGSFIHLSEV